VGIVGIVGREGHLGGGRVLGIERGGGGGVGGRIEEGRGIGIWIPIGEGNLVGMEGRREVVKEDIVSRSRSRYGCGRLGIGDCVGDG